MLKLNSIAPSVFEANETEDRVVKAGGKDISLRNLVATGRALVCEYIGTNLSKRPGSDKYTSRLNGVDYGTLSKKFNEKLIMYCAAVANLNDGLSAPSSFEKVKSDLSYSGNRHFLSAYNAIAREIIQPLLFKVFDDVSAGNLMKWESIPFGSTKEIEIRSNDVFMFEDSSWGSGRSASYNTLYKKSITLNPTMSTTQVSLKWYQDVVNGDPGYVFAAIMNGLWNKIYAKFISQLLTAAQNVDYIPTALKATTYSTTNWNTITTKVAAVNGLKRSDLLAFGGINALSKVLPTDGTGAAIVGLQYGLGEEWFKRGFLPNASGVQLLEVEPVIVPGTQNTTIDTLDLGNNIFVAAKAGAGYAPLYGGYFEGSPITLEMTPSQTANFTIDINVGAIFDVKPVFATKVGVITNVS